MKNLGWFLDHLQDLSDEDTFYARRPWSIASDAEVAEAGSDIAHKALDAGLEYLLEVSLAKDVIATWSSWRRGEIPNTAQGYHAIAHYATHDAYLEP